jgi:hypothetical protein
MQFIPITHSSFCPHALCLPAARALARTLGDGSNHDQQRKNVVDFMRENRDDFEPFVENDMYAIHVRNDSSVFYLFRIGIDCRVAA